MKNRIEESLNEYESKLETLTETLTKKNYNHQIGILIRDVREMVDNIYLEEYKTLPDIRCSVDTSYMGAIHILFKIDHRHEMDNHSIDMVLPVYDLDLFQYLQWKKVGL